MPDRDHARLHPSLAGIVNPGPPPVAADTFVCLREGDGDRGIRLTLSGELDIAGTPELERELRGAQQSARAVTIDLSGLTFMDCTSLSLLAAAAGRARASDDRFDVVRGPPQISRLFALTGISGLL